MKKIVFSLLAIGVMTFANATESNVGKKKLKQQKKEAVSKKEQKAVSQEEDKKVFCAIWDGDSWEAYSYSCFFCWGGSHNGCIAEGAEYYGVGQ